MREQDGLGALQMRIAGHDRIQIGLGAGYQHGLQSGDGRVEHGEGFQQPQAEIGGDLVVTAAPGVQLAGQRADQLGQAALYGGMDVFI